MSADLQTHYRVCNLCEAMCGLAIEHDGERVIRIKGDEKDPLSKGSICPKGALIQKLHEDPDRLRQPLLKNAAGAWETIGWTEAFDLAGERLNAIRRASGDDAVGLYFGNPTVHNYGILTMLGELRRVLGSRNVFSATSMDQLPHHFVAYQVFGHPLNVAIPDIERTDLLLIFGGNPLASNGSLMSAPGIGRRFREMRERGCKIIQFDPRYNETSRVIDQHHFIRPDTDVYLLAGMLREVLTNKWDQTGHLAELLPAYSELKALTAPFTPARVEAITGVSAEVLTELTKTFATTERAVIYGRMGVSTQRHGGLCHWLIAVLNILTAHCDRPGGAMFTQPAVDVKRRRKFKKVFDRWRSRVRQLPEFMGELPVATLVDEIVTPGEGQIKAMIIHAGNPVLSSPNGKRLNKALASLDFCVSIDIYLNETSRHADLILPPPSHLEVDHYDLIFNLFAVRNNAKFSPALFAPAPGQRYDWQIARALIERLATESKKKPSRLLRYLNPRQLLNLGLMTGPYGKLQSWKKAWSGLSLSKLKNSIHGVDLGALQACLATELRTKSGLIELLPTVYLDALQGLANTIESGEMTEEKAGRNYQLIGRRHLRSNNSWMHNVKELVRGKPRCTVMLHPDDATKIGAAEGVMINVISRTGKISLPAAIDSSIMPGVVSIPHGFGHHGRGTQLSTAASSEVAGVSLNDITDHKRLDSITGNAAFSGQWVSLELG